MPLNVEKVKSGPSGGMGRLAEVRSRLDGVDSALPAPLDDVLPASRLEARPFDAEFAAWVLGPAARVPRLASRPGLQAVLFDLDGVLVDTAEFHYLAWKRLADDLGIRFDPQMNDAFRGVGRMECLDKLLGEHGRFFAAEEKRLLADCKNNYYLEQVQKLTGGDLAPGAAALIAGLKGASYGGIRLAVVSASRNARLVLDRLAIGDWFDAIIDGNDVTRGKPDPQGFLLAAERLRVCTDRCVVVEDGESGARAGVGAGMEVLGIGEAVRSARVVVRGLEEVTVELLERMAAIIPA